MATWKELCDILGCECTGNYGPACDAARLLEKDRDVWRKSAEARQTKHEAAAKERNDARAEVARLRAEVERQETLCAMAKNNAEYWSEAHTRLAKRLDSEGPVIRTGTGPLTPPDTHEARRWEAAKAVIGGLCANPQFDWSPGVTATAWQIADVLLAEYERETKAPLAVTTAPSVLYCDARSPDGYRCTGRPGHTGPHAVADQSWANTAEPAPTPPAEPEKRVELPEWAKELQEAWVAIDYEPATGVWDRLSRAVHAAITAARGAGK